MYIQVTAREAGHRGIQRPFSPFLFFFFFPAESRTVSGGRRDWSRPGLQGCSKAFLTWRLDLQGSGGVKGDFRLRNKSLSSIELLGDFNTWMVTLNSKKRIYYVAFPKNLITESRLPHLPRDLRLYNGTLVHSGSYCQRHTRKCLTFYIYIYIRNSSWHLKGSFLPGGLHFNLCQRWTEVHHKVYFPHALKNYSI